MKIRIVTTLLAIAVASSSAPSFAQSTEQRVVRPGIAMRPAWLGLQLGKTDDAPGVEVRNVLRRSPADGTGIVVGDRVLSIDGEAVNSLRDVQRVVRARGAGKSVKLAADRGGKRVKVAIELAEMPDPEVVVQRHLVGFPAPDFTFQYIGDASSSDLSALKGRPTVIDFWATWCGPCHAVQRQLADIKKGFGDRINVIGLSDEDPARVRKHLTKYPASYAMAVDTTGSAQALFAIASFPTVVILDADQKVAAVMFGTGNQAAIEKKLRNLVESP